MYQCLERLDFAWHNKQLAVVSPIPGGWYGSLCGLMYVKIYSSYVGCNIVCFFMLFFNLFDKEFESRYENLEKC
jgi:hypothetical protein